jgi:hypothetical protein
VIFRVDPVVLCNKLIAHDMVNMAMGVEISDELQFVFSNKVPDHILLLCGIAGSIDENAFTGFIV